MSMLNAMLSTYDDHDFPTYSNSNNLPQQVQEHNASNDSDVDQNFPPRPESRLDFTNQVQSKTSRSHRRSPSSTLRWTREILKKIRLPSSISSSSSSGNLLPCSSIESRSDSMGIASPTSAFVASAEIDCSVISSDVALMSRCFDNVIDSSISISSSISSSSSSHSWPALDNLSISLSSSSEFDSSCEDTDEDSDLDLDSLKEIDLADGLSGDEDIMQNFAFVSAVRGKRSYITHVDVDHSKQHLIERPTLTFSSSSTPISSDTETFPEPFCTSTSDLEDPSLDYPCEPRTKYTCLPSPLSICSIPTSGSEEPITPPPSYPQPPRHLYAHRGHSRHALLYRKWFWALREEDWARYGEWIEEYRSQQEAYAGFSSSDVADSHAGNDRDSEGTLLQIPNNDQYKFFPSLFASAREVSPNNCRPWDEKSRCDGLLECHLPSGSPPLTIHPRWGDLVNMTLAKYSSAAACTDTWCLHTDRYLLVGMGLGLWTIRKVLWLSELKRIITLDGPKAGDEETEKTYVADNDDGISEATEDEDGSEEGAIACSSVVSLVSLASATESSSSISNSDDSDVTLVESDNESERPPPIPSVEDREDLLCSGRTVDFEKTCSSTFAAFDDEEDGFEEVDLGLDIGSSTMRSTGYPAIQSTDICATDPESAALLRSLYLSQPTESLPSPSLSTSSTAVTANSCFPLQETLSSKGKSKSYQLLRQKVSSLEKKSWYEQCELLLILTGARPTST